MKQRVISSVVGVLLLCIILIFYQSFPLILNVAIAVISVIAVFEMLGAVGLLTHKSIIILSTVFAGIMPFVEFDTYGKMICIAYLFTMFLMLIIFNKKISLNQIIVSAAINILVVLSFGMLIKLSLIDTSNGIFYILIALACSWMADIGGYLVGSKFGKHKLAANVSPKKTIEGVIGGVLFSGIAIALIGFVYSTIIYPNTNINYIVLISTALISSPISVLGDLSFSMIKRTYEIKDFGKIMPGHGGILDRFDSVIFVVPFVYFVLSYFPIFS